MTAVFALPPLRAEISDMLEAEALIRHARRQRIEQRPSAADADGAAVAAIDVAIAHLVAARHTISTAAEAAPSKDL